MRRISFFILAVVLFAACKKGQTKSPVLPNNKIAGKWTIVSVTVNALDSTRNFIPSRSHVYTNPPNNYFKFNADGTWAEQLVPDSLSDLGLTGNYVLNSDTTFTLLHSGPNSAPTACKISSLSPSLFVFSHERSTKFDGTIPGFLQYVFKLTK